MSLVSEIKNDINGLAALRDWLGDSGDPVHPILAEMRAQRCVEGNDGDPCPLNRAPKWWEKAKEVAADWIRKELEIKSHMNLRVAQEERLNMCAACGCCLPLKVWVPRDYIRKHTSAEVLAKTTSYCWLRKECADTIDP